jgi:hypothetical protein
MHQTQDTCAWSTRARDSGLRTSGIGCLMSRRSDPLAMCLPYLSLCADAKHPTECPF